MPDGPGSSQQFTAKAAQLSKAKATPRADRTSGLRRAAIELLETEIERALATGRPIVAGPFLGEVGFELLYWIPLLRWAVERYPELGPRLHVVARGGTATWYAGISDSYVDALTLYSAEEFVRRRGFKQRRESEFDAELLWRVAMELGLERVATIHPRLFWQSYFPNMKRDPRTYSRAIERADDGAVRGFAARYERFEVPPRGVLAAVLPDVPYVAARYYFRPSFPDTPENRGAARRMIAALARHRPVVVLNNRMELDDHVDLEVDAEQPVVTIHEHMTPANNLAIQSTAVSHAAAFYGTYGGLAYLPPHFGVPAFGLIDHPLEVRQWHAELAHEIFAAPGWGALTLQTPTAVTTAS